jgi:hypothetical protein
MKIFHYIILGIVNKGNICACLCGVFICVCVCMKLCVQTQYYLFQDKYICMYGQSSTQITIEYTQFNT